MKNLNTLIAMSTLIISAQGQDATPAAAEAQDCNDRQTRLEDGTCSDCPAFTRAQNNNSYCNSDQCDFQTQIITSDGSCRSCPEGQEPSESLLDCHDPSLSCDGNEVRQGGECVTCPAYTRAQSNNTFCSPDMCDENSIILPTGSCQECEAGTKPDITWMTCVSAEVQTESCNDRQIELTDHLGNLVCQDCPDFTRAQGGNWNCAADRCNYNRQIITQDGTCQTCPENQRPDMSRQVCEQNGDEVVAQEEEAVEEPAQITEVVEQPTEEAVQEEETESEPEIEVVQAAPSSSCNHEWQITLEDGSCQACPEYTRPQNNGSECLPNECEPNEFLHHWGHCVACPQGWISSGRGCQEGANVLASLPDVQTCNDREVRQGLECFPCPGFTRAQDNNSRCAADACEPNQMLTEAGSCLTCTDGTSPDFTQRSCVENVSSMTCSDREIFVADYNMCLQCPDYTRPQTSNNNNRCLPDECRSDQILTQSGNCAECQPGTVVDARNRSCVSVAVATPEPSVCGENQISHDGECVYCPSGFVANQSRTSCMAQSGPVQSVCGDRQIRSEDGLSCDECFPYTRAQNGGTSCGSDECYDGVIQFDGTCTICPRGTRPDRYMRNCEQNLFTDLRAIVEEPLEDLEKAPEAQVETPGNGNLKAFFMGGAIFSAIILSIGFVIYKFQQSIKLGAQNHVEMPETANKQPKTMPFDMASSPDNEQKPKEINTNIDSQKKLVDEELQEIELDENQQESVDGPGDFKSRQ